MAAAGGAPPCPAVGFVLVWTAGRRGKGRSTGAPRGWAAASATSRRRPPRGGCTASRMRSPTACSRPSGWPPAGTRRCHRLHPGRFSLTAATAGRPTGAPRRAPRRRLPGPPPRRAWPAPRAAPPSRQRWPQTGRERGEGVGAHLGGHAGRAVRGATRALRLGGQGGCGGTPAVRAPRRRGPPRGSGGSGGRHRRRRRCDRREQRGAQKARPPGRPRARGRRRGRAPTQRRLQ